MKRIFMTIACVGNSAVVLGALEEGRENFFSRLLRPSGSLGSSEFNSGQGRGGLAKEVATVPYDLDDEVPNVGGVSTAQKRKVSEGARGNSFHADDEADEVFLSPVLQGRKRLKRKRGPHAPAKETFYSSEEDDSADEYDDALRILGVARKYYRLAVKKEESRGALADLLGVQEAMPAEQPAASVLMRLEESIVSRRNDLECHKMEQKRMREMLQEILNDLTAASEEESPTDAGVVIV